MPSINPSYITYFLHAMSNFISLFWCVIFGSWNCKFDSQFESLEQYDYVWRQLNVRKIIWIRYLLFLQTFCSAETIPKCKSVYKVLLWMILLIQRHFTHKCFNKKDKQIMHKPLNKINPLILECCFTLLRLQDHNYIFWFFLLRPFYYRFFLLTLVSFDINVLCKILPFVLSQS